MIDATRLESPDRGGQAELYAVGDRAKGEFRCCACGYGVAIVATLPRCPMCSGRTWERGPWTPFARADARRRPQPSA